MAEVETMDRHRSTRMEHDDAPPGLVTCERQRVSGRLRFLRELFCNLGRARFHPSRKPVGTMRFQTDENTNGAIHLSVCVLSLDCANVYVDLPAIFRASFGEDCVGQRRLAARDV